MSLFSSFLLSQYLKYVTKKQTQKAQHCHTKWFSPEDFRTKMNWITAPRSSRLLLFFNCQEFLIYSC